MSATLLHPGDRVSFVDEVGGGIILQVLGHNMVRVRTDDGFELDRARAMKGSRRRKRATRIAGRIGGPKVLGPNFKFRSMIGAGMRKGPPWCGEPFKKSLCICKPGPVSTLRRISIIYLAVPSPARSSDLPSGIERVVLIHLAVKPRYTWSFSPWGLPSHAARTACWWALTPPFHPYLHLAVGRRSPFLRHFPWRHRHQ